MATESEAIQAQSFSAMSTLAVATDRRATVRVIFAASAARMPPGRAS